MIVGLFHHVYPLHPGGLVARTGGGRVNKADLASRAEQADLEVRRVRLKVAPTEALALYPVPQSVELVTDLRELPDMAGLAPREGPERPPGPDAADELAILRDWRAKLADISSQLRSSSKIRHLQPGPWLKW